MADAFMSSGEICSECGAVLPANWPRGLCSRCALNGALGLGDFEGGQESTAGSARPFGDYELLQEVARGGMGIVYKARQKGLDRIVAIKMLLFGPMADQGAIRRFRGEAVAAGGLRHPNIVAIHEVGIHEGQQFLAMDYVDGPNLAAFAARYPLPPRRAAEFMKVVSEAIHYAHGSGVLHRDLKPSNILVDSNEVPHVTDFGLARRIEGDSSLTITGQTLGSPGYMPPEQAVSRSGKISARSDVYGLGATLYHLLTGRPPFQGESIAETLDRVIKMEPVSPRLINASTPQDLETICLKCLQKQQEKRYASAGELADELSRFLKGEPIRARPIGAAEKAWRFCRRNPALSSLGAAAALLLLIVAIGSPISAWRIRKSEQALAENLYAADLQLVEISLREGNWGRARSLLKAHEPKAGERDLRGFEWRYFKTLAHGDQLRTIHAHTNMATALAFAPDGRTLVSAGYDGAVRFWDYPTMRIEGEISVPDAKFTGLSFRSDGELLAATTEDRVAYLWQMKTRQMVTNFIEFGNRAVFEPSGNRFVLVGGRPWGDSAGPLRIWDSERKVDLRAWETVGSRAAWMPDGKRLVVGPHEEGIALLDIESGRIRPLHQTGRIVLSIAVSPDGKTLAAATIDIKSPARSLWLWKLDSGKLLGELRGHTANIWQICFSPDGRLLASASSDQSIRIWDIETRQQRSILRGHGNEVWTVTFSPDGRNLVSGDKEGSLMMWALPDAPRDDLNSRIDQVVGPRVFSPDGRWMAVGIGRNQVGLIDLEGNQVARVLDNAICPVGFEGNGETLVTLNANTVTRTSLSGNQAPTRSPLQPPLVNTFMAISADRRLLAAENEPGQIFLWDLAQGKLLEQAALPKGRRVTALTFSPDGSHLAIVREETAEVLLYSGGLKSVRTLKGHALAAWAAAFNKDSSVMATAAMDDRIFLWRPKTGEVIARLEGHKEGVFGVAFSSDDRTLAALCGNRTIKLWNVPTHREVGNLSFARTLISVEFSPNGQMLLAHNPWKPDARFEFWRADAPATH